MSDYITPTRLRNEGWTDGLIAKYLGKADRLADNPHYKCAPPMRLYLIKRVVKIAKRKKVTACLAKVLAERSNRQRGARAAVETKTICAETEMAEETNNSVEHLRDESTQRVQAAPKDSDSVERRTTSED